MQPRAGHQSTRNMVEMEVAIFFGGRFCLAWPRGAMACPARSVKSIRGDGHTQGGGTDMGAIGR